jgi:hypothetical protein
LNDATDRILLDPSYLPTEAEVAACFPGVREWPVPLKQYFESHNRPYFELLTQESVNAWADYLVAAWGDHPSVVWILEVGAGSGRLSHFLYLALEQRAPGRFVVIATDSGAWQLPHYFPVEQLNAEDAIQLYHPEVVLACWSVIKDLQALCRRYRVPELLMIGETNCCDSMVETYNYPDPEDIVVDGYRLDVLEAVGNVQTSRNDDWLFGRHRRLSWTQSFRLQPE